MDYEKKYNDALERARYVLHTVETAGCAMHKDLLTEIFPELRESEDEDERIRKEIIDIVEAYRANCVYEGTHRFDDCIAYLEKQKAQKPMDKIDLKFNIGDTIVNKKNGEKCTISNRCLLHQYYSDTNHCHEIKFDEQDDWELVKEQKPNFSEEDSTDFEIEVHEIIAQARNDSRLNDEDVLKQFEEEAAFALMLKANKLIEQQKPAKWSEDWREEDVQTRFAFYTYKDEDDVLYLSNVFVEETSRNHGFGTRILRAAEKVAETIGATIIRLKVKQDSPANAWYRKNGYEYVVFEDGYDWLEKNLKYLKPKKSIKWSGDDELMIESLIAYLKGTGQDFISNDMVYWLKSLPERFNLQPKQEWSEEDEEKLKAICTYLRDYPRLAKLGDKLRFNEYCDFLKSLPERFNLQPKLEWSEEDKAMIERLIRHTQEEFDELCNDRYGHQEIISDLKESCRERMNWLENRLKSLRPSWKPSDQDELMKLKYAGTSTKLD